MEVAGVVLASSRVSVSGSGVAPVELWDAVSHTAVLNDHSSDSPGLAEDLCWGLGKILKRNVTRKLRLLLCVVVQTVARVIVTQAAEAGRP